jgi:GNAT superfamily N-acetyltransferase
LKSNKSSPRTNISGLKIRYLAENDDLKELTGLLHRAYKKLGDRGFRYVATHQNVKTTEKRIKNGKCLVAVLGEKIIGTITYYSPDNTSGNEWYNKETVAAYGQFGVEPEYQSYGIGSRLIDEAEKIALEDKAEEIAIDTAEGAAELISFYEKKGYRHVGYVKWEVTNYRSVLMSKKIFA